eukprot:5644782-Amphidinium_carterae.1
MFGCALEAYPGTVQLVTIHFPTPFAQAGSGNLQLPRSAVETSKRSCSCQTQNPNEYSQLCSQGPKRQHRPILFLRV